MVVSWLSAVEPRRQWPGLKCDGHPNIVSTPSDALTLPDILAAFAQGRIVSCYQPIVKLTDRRVVGVEALARIEHPSSGMLAPEWFVPQIEAAGLAGMLTETVVRHAFQHLGARFFADRELSLALNLPLDVLLDRQMLAQVAADCAEAGMDPGLVVIELTERVAVSDFGGLADTLLQWRAAGFQVAIDDAGPNTRNLPSLFALPFSAIKLDKSVVQGSAGNLFARASVRRTIEAAKRSGLRVVAEGIEDSMGWHRMDDLGVDEVQGFLVAEPLTAAALPAWLDEWEARLVA